MIDIEADVLVTDFSSVGYYMNYLRYISSSRPFCFVIIYKSLCS